MKVTYNDCTHKQSLQNSIISSLSGFNKVYCLGGPDIRRREEFFKSKGVKRLISYEIDPGVFKKQKYYSLGFAKLVLGDILQAPFESNSFYELDYCTTIRYLGDHVTKFKTNFLFTFCLRGCSKDETIDTFLSSRGERRVSKKLVEAKVKHEFFSTSYFSSNKGTYGFYTYRDQHSPPMCCIKKLI